MGNYFAELANKTQLSKVIAVSMFNTKLKSCVIFFVLNFMHYIHFTNFVKGEQ